MTGVDHDRRAVALVSAGGVIGALTRYGIEAAWPHPAGGFPWATWVINVSGCLLIGMIAVWIARFRPQQRYLRPFLGATSPGLAPVAAEDHLFVLIASPAGARAPSRSNSTGVWALSPSTWCIESATRA